jgi:hypothetical protein
MHLIHFDFYNNVSLFLYEFTSRNKKKNRNNILH